MARLLIAVYISASLAACASTGAVYTPRPFPNPGERPATVAIPPPPTRGTGAPPAAAAVPPPSSRPDARLPR